MGHLHAQEEFADDLILSLPSAHYLPIAGEIVTRDTHQGLKENRLKLRTRAFSVEAPVNFKGWRMQHKSNNQVSIYNILRQDATVTFSLFNSFLFTQPARKFENWEEAYLEGMILERKLAVETDTDETFPDTGKYPHYLFSKAPTSVIDYEHEDLATGQKYLCRDYFIEYRISSTQRYTLLIQFKRPADFGAVTFRGLFESLHAIVPAKEEDIT